MLGTCNDKGIEVEIISESHATAYGSAIGKHNVNISNIYEETLRTQFGLSNNSVSSVSDVQVKKMLVTLSNSLDIILAPASRHNSVRSRPLGSYKTPLPG
jgi:hypothetical protein